MVASVRRRMAETVTFAGGRIATNVAGAAGLASFAATRRGSRWGERWQTMTSADELPSPATAI